MSEKKSVRDEPWFKNVPDYMGEAIVLITETRDEARMLLESMRSRDQILGERESALLSAVNDMKEFANQLYGPESELTKINAKLDAIERSGSTRDMDCTRRLQEISDNQAQLKQWCEEQVSGIDRRVQTTERAIDQLQRKIA